MFIDNEAKQVITYYKVCIGQQIVSGRNQPLLTWKINLIFCINYFDIVFLHYINQI